MPTSTTSAPKLQNVVQVSDDYSKFAIIDANRDLSRSHIERLKESFEENGNLTQVQPVLVNEKNQIIDGQHRFVACQELNEPVYYTVVPGIGIHEARQMNLLHKRWASEDFLKTYAAEGKRPYIMFQQLCEEYPDFTFSIILAAVKSHQTSGAQATFRRGELATFKPEEVKARLDKLSELAEINSAFKSRAMAYAYFRAAQAEGFKHEYLVQKVEERGPELRAYQGVMDNLRQLEYLYNWNRGTQNRIRFF